MPLVDGSQRRDNGASAAGDGAEVEEERRCPEREILRKNEAIGLDKECGFVFNRSDNLNSQGGVK